MTVAMIAFWAMVIVAVVALFRGSRTSEESSRPDPVDILEQRFARGEIDEDDFHAPGPAHVGSLTMAGHPPALPIPSLANIPLGGMLDV